MTVIFYYYFFSLVVDIIWEFELYGIQYKINGFQIRTEMPTKFYPFMYFNIEIALVILEKRNFSNF